MHIAIEGIDGVGKSTIAQRLADRLAFTYVEKPLKYLFDNPGEDHNYIRIRDYVNKQPDRFFTSWFYGLGNIFLYHKFKGQNIITDRHLVSNYCWSGAQESEPVFDLLVKELGSPDFTFLIYASPDVVISRIKKRDQDDPDTTKARLIPELYPKMEGFLKRYNMKYLLIDSSNLAVNQIITIILDTLKQNGLV
jgi:thymidylate kinase